MDTTTALGLAAGTFILGYILGQISRAKAGPPPEPVAPDLAALEQVRPILERQGKIQAIKEYRALTGTGLRDAKNAVDSLESRR